MRYSIAVDGYDLFSTGTAQVTISPANDRFEDRVVIRDGGGGNVVVSGTTRGATLEANERSILPEFGSAGSVWHTWTADVSGEVNVVVDDGTLVAIFTGGTLDSLQRAASENELGGLSFEAVAGTTYQLAVATLGGSGPFTIGIPRNQRPRIRFESPVDFQRIVRTEPTNVVLRLEASDLDGTISNVMVESFAQDLLVELTQAPFEVVLTNADGFIFATAVATDNAGLSREAILRFWVTGPPPGNDDFSNATPLSGTSLSVDGTTVNGSTELGETSLVRPTVWYRWTALGDGAVQVGTGIESLDTRVFTGESLAGLVAVSSGEPARFSARAGTTYHFSVSGLPQVFQLSLEVSSPLNLGFVLPGDNAQSLDPEGLAVEVEASVAGAAIERVEFGSNFGWFSLDTAAPFQGFITNGPPGGYAEFTATAFDTRGFSRNETLRARFAAPPASDDFADAPWIAGTNVFAAGSNAGATREAGEPRRVLREDQSQEAAGTTSVWWKWVAPQNGTVTLSTSVPGGGVEQQSEFDTQLGVYTGYQFPLEEVASNAGAVELGGRKWGEVQFGVAAGTTYYFMINGSGSQSGVIRLYLRLIPPRSLGISAG